MSSDLITRLEPLEVKGSLTFFGLSNYAVPFILTPLVRTQYDAA